MACFVGRTDALAWLDAPSTSDDGIDRLFMDLITTPKAAARTQQQKLRTALPATQQQRQVNSPPQVVPKVLLPFPAHHDAPAAFRQDCCGLGQQPWDFQEPSAALISDPTSNHGLFAAFDASAAWDASQLVPHLDDNSAGQLHGPGFAPQHISTGFSSGPSALPAQFPAGFSSATTAPWSLSSTELQQQLPPVLNRFQPLPRSYPCAGMGCSASPACLLPESCSTALPRPASAGSLSPAESAATVAAVLAAAAQPQACAARRGHRALEGTPSLASAAGIDRFHAALLTGGRPALHTLPLPRGISSAGSAALASGSSMLGNRAAAAQQAAMLGAASGGASLPAVVGPTAPTAGQAVSAVRGSGYDSGGGSSSRDSALKGSGPVMKPPAARLSRPVSGAIVKPPRAAQVQQRRSGLQEALQAAAVEAEESKIQALASRRAILQSTVKAQQDSKAQLAANLDTLLTDVAAMSASNQQLKAANRQVKAQVQALLLQLQQTSLRVA